MAVVTAEDAKIIAKLQREDALKKLATLLGLTEIDEEDDFQLAIFIDYLYDNLMFTVQKGFPWQHVCHLVGLSKDMLEQSKGQSLTAAVAIYQSKCEELLQKVSAQNLKIFTEHYFATFFAHYKLYQYVFTAVREGLVSKVTLTVDTPGSPMPFTEAQPLGTWEYERQIEAIKQEEDKRHEERGMEKEALTKEQEKAHQSFERLKENESQSENQKLDDIIHQVAEEHIHAASHIIQTNMEETFEDLQFMLAKTSLPRPQQLGPPPRYSIKPPLTVPKSLKTINPKRVKSSKSRVGSRASSKIK